MATTTMTTTTMAITITMANNVSNCLFVYLFVLVYSLHVPCGHFSTFVASSIVHATNDAALFKPNRQTASVGHSNNLKLTFNTVNKHTHKYIIATLIITLDL